jgi:aminopeptidase N
MIVSLLAFTMIVRSFDVDVHIDRAAKTIHGIERIELSSSDDPLRLPLKGQIVSAVSCGDRPAAFTTEASILEVEACAAGSITIRYTAHEPKGITFAPSIAYTTFDTCSWMVCDEDPSHRAPVSLTLHAPPDEWTLASGTLQSVRGEAGGRTFRWQDARSRSAYLYGFAVGPLRSASVVEGDATLIAMSTDVSESELVGVLRHSEGMVRFFETAAGRPLPDGRYTQLIVKGSAAQEKSTFSIIGTEELAALATDPSEDWVIAHELAHQFWGNSVTPRSWSEMWLSEGVVTFMTAAWKEHRWGRAAFDREMSLAERRVKVAIDAGYDKPLAWPGDYPSLRIRRAIAYSRGALFMNLLRQQLGEDVFWHALRRYTTTFAEQTVTSGDFQRAFERSSSRNLTLLFRQWVFEGPVTTGSTEPPAPPGSATRGTYGDRRSPGL